MLTIHLTWDLPTTRVDGTPLSPSEIAQVTVLDQFTGNTSQLPGTATSFDSGDVTGQAGDHVFSVVVIDTQAPPVSSSVAQVTVTVPAAALAAPSPVANLAGSLVSS